jgi:hypothetical protein
MNFGSLYAEPGWLIADLTHLLAEKTAILTIVILSFQTIAFRTKIASNRSRWFAVL